MWQSRWTEAIRCKLEYKYFSDSFMGVELFAFPVPFKIWNIYLSKFITFSDHFLEWVQTGTCTRSALEKCPPKSCRPLFLIYGLKRIKVSLKDQLSFTIGATQVVNDEDKFEVCLICLGLKH